MALIDDIATFLQQNAVGTFGTDIFGYEMPDKPDACVAVYEYPGRAPEYVHDGGGPRYENPNFQIAVRDKKYQDARDKAQKIWNLLAAVTNLNLSGVRYQSITPIQSPFSLGPDENKRPIVAANFQATRDAA